MASETTHVLLQSYRSLRVIRKRTGFEVYSAERRRDGRACVVVIPGLAADYTRVAGIFETVEVAHAQLDHPRIPEISGRGHIAGVPFLELDCPAVVDATEAIRMMSHSDEKIPYGGADAFIVSIRVAMEIGHAARDPRTGKPLCLGRLAATNVLVGRDGQWWVVGFGRNWPVEKDDGTVDGTVGFFQAPELWSGGEPSPSGDYVALLVFMRSVLPYVEIRGTIARVLMGQTLPEDEELIECLRWTDLRMLGEIPSRRASIAEAVVVADRIRALAGVVPDEEAFAAHCAGLIDRFDDPVTIPDEATTPRHVLTVGPDTRWLLGPGGERVTLGKAPRLVLSALIDHAARGSLGGLTTVQLLEAGWPGEEPSYEAGAARVYVTLNRLRRFGLEDAIERFDDGYRLARHVSVLVVPD